MQSFSERGGWWVMAQFTLLLAVAAAPPMIPDIPALLAGNADLALLAGLALGVVGVLLASVGLLHLGANLTPFPRPLDTSTLVQSGAYAIVRHPIYSGIILASFGWSMMRESWIALLLSTGLLIFFHYKSRREETWLVMRYPGYFDYQRRVKKLIPWIW